MDFEALKLKARELLAADPDCWVKGALAKEDLECANAHSKIPGKLQGPGFPLDISVDKPLYKAHLQWEKQCAENNVHILTMECVHSDYEEAFFKRLDRKSNIGCFDCEITNLQRCKCDRCKLCDSKSCSMDCYVDGKTYLCDYD